MQVQDSQNRRIRKLIFAGLAALAVCILGCFLFIQAIFHKDWIRERWYVWSFEHGGEAKREAALRGLAQMRSLELIPLCLRVMEEKGTREGIGFVACFRLTDSFPDAGRAIQLYSERPGSWDADRFKKAFKTIYPQWNGEFDQKGIDDFVRRLYWEGIVH